MSSEVSVLASLGGAQPCDTVRVADIRLFYPRLSSI